MPVSRRIKHSLDRVGAFLLLLLLAPLLGCIALCIVLDSPGSPLFLQERVGEGGHTFRIFKFRTMRAGSEREGLGRSTASDDARITRVGAWLRAMSLDELPQLLNIARGEMSFIGPRPTLRYQVDAYTSRQQGRLLVRPGITGWAQVHGRNEIPWSKRIEYDLEYVERYSLWLDLQVLWRTLGTLGSRTGVYAAGEINDAFVPEAAAVDSCAAAIPLLVLGAGGHGKVVLDIAARLDRYRVIGLLDDRPELAGTTILGFPVLGNMELLTRADMPRHAVVAIGSGPARQAWQERLEALGFELVVLVHPSAQVAREVVLGAGSVLMAGSVVNSGTRLGRGVIVNTGASVDHDCDIGDFTHVAPGARLAGGVRAGRLAHIGIGSCVLQSLTIGAEATVGGGAAVVRDVPAGTTVIGVPARPLPLGAATKPPRSHQQLHMIGP